MTEVLALAGLVLACWIFRITFVLLMPAEKLPARVQQGLTYLAPAVLAAMVAVELTGMLTTADVRGSLLVLLAAGLVALVARRFRNLTLTVAVGLVAVLGIDLLL